ncbi:hypothetical protein DFA_06200 [Cavenderia fasciculata]|uniref:Uncharacterized protein n=1 Tax=Cavenderia fasciculata TaxID=261658 RepID=F4PKD8_CACFS|nr:uncharacterized protein DFA_06200 [Cavenderia fasciculata]EGG24062.1 hypothetical protein DFA_06200 [Cavenderia fasciculata]|eukprot:XP_004361913.1 hypothetical protein DFA_06200 [Cavenderia fasciculata]
MSESLVDIGFDTTPSTTTTTNQLNDGNNNQNEPKNLEDILPLGKEALIGYNSPSTGKNDQKGKKNTNTKAQQNSLSSSNQDSLTSSQILDGFGMNTNTTTSNSEVPDKKIKEDELLIDFSSPPLPKKNLK